MPFFRQRAGSTSFSLVFELLFLCLFLCHGKSSCDRLCRLRIGSTRAARLFASYVYYEFTCLNHFLPRIIDCHHLCRLNRERDFFLLPRFEKDAPNSSQRPDWRDRGIIDHGRIQIQLHYFITRSAAGIYDIDAHLYLISRLDFLRTQLQIRIAEFRVAQSEAEWVERFTREIAVCAPLHPIIFERRKLVDGFIECHGESSARVVISEDHVSDRRATFFSRIPGFNDCWHVLIFPIDCQGAAT